MRLIAALSALCTVALVAAQDPVVIEVGGTADEAGGVFQFKPNNVNVTVNGTITFRFTGLPGNHSVTQSSFANPCTPVAGGFDSGNIQVPVGNTEVPEWNVTITNTTKPIWFFCKQLAPSPHCKAGMVGAVNAPASGNNTFAAFQQSAEAFTGNVDQSQGGLSGIGAVATTVVGPIGSGVTTFLGPSKASSTGSSASGSSSSSTATPSNNAASPMAATPFVAFFAALMGLTLA